MRTWKLAGSNPDPDTFRGPEIWGQPDKALETDRLPFLLPFLPGCAPPPPPLHRHLQHSHPLRILCVILSVTLRRELVASFFSTRGFEAHEGPKLTSVLKLKSASLRLGDFCIVIPRYDMRRDYDHELSPSSLSLRCVIDLAALIAPQAVQSNRYRRR
ncbi:unnamed protein product [Sphagnum jensenii]|uniref:Uncharacterized protein n=1 Tax=Sphagnum jensenii TaxID=128206 RepID=A0ABP1BSQ6_9BRYO